VKLSKAAWQYVNDPASGLRTPSSVATYEQQLNYLVRDVGDIDVNDVSPDAIVDWVMNANVATATQSLRRSVVLAFYRWCEFRDVVTGRNPARKAEGLRITRKRVRQGNWLSPKQVGQLVAACDTGDDYGHRDRVVLLVALLTGLRRTEIANLKWGDIDLANGTLRLVGKGEKLVTFGLPGQLVEELTSWRAKFPEVTATTPVICRVSKPATAFSGAVLTIYWDEPVGPQAIFGVVKRRARLAGMPDIATHDLRRTYASFVHKTLPLEEVSKLLRHSDVSTTQRYLADDPAKTVTNGQAFSIDLDA
jgi:integrase